MRYIVVLAALLLTPIAANADFVHDSSDIAVEVTISVAGTVPLASGDLVLDDVFVLRGRGRASLASVTFPPPSVFQSYHEATFSVSGGSTSAIGSVFDYEARDSGYSILGWLMLDTPLYSLGFSQQDPRNANAFIFMSAPIQGVSFFAQSNEAGVTVGGENSFLVGTASFTGTGFAVVPEPGATILLLVLGVTSIAVWRRRGEEPTASRPATPPSARP